MECSQLVELVTLLGLTCMWAILSRVMGLTLVSHYNIQPKEFSRLKFQVLVERGTVATNLVLLLLHLLALCSSCFLILPPGRKLVRNASRRLAEVAQDTCQFAHNYVHDCLSRAELFHAAVFRYSHSGRPAAVLVLVLGGRCVYNASNAHGKWHFTSTGAISITLSSRGREGRPQEKTFSFEEESLEWTDGTGNVRLHEVSGVTKRQLLKKLRIRG